MTTYATASAQTGGVATQTADYLPNLYAHAGDAEHPAASISNADDVGSDEECYLAATKLALERLLVRVAASRTPSAPRTVESATKRTKRSVRETLTHDDLLVERRYAMASSSRRSGPATLHRAKPQSTI